MLYLCTRILVLSKFVDLLSASVEYVHISGQFFSLPSLPYINIIYPLNTFTIYNIFTLPRGVVSSSFKTRLINVYLYH